MALTANLTLTVDGVSRSYNELDEKATGKELPGRKRKVALSDGESMFRVSHEEKGARERALVELSEIRVNATTEAQSTQKVYIVLDQPAGPNLRRSELKALAVTLCTWLTANSGANLDAVLLGEA